MIDVLVIFLLSIPAGFLIAWFARDELEAGRKWFRILLIASFLGIVWFWLTGFREISWTLGFVFSSVLVSLVKSIDKKWTKI